MMYVHVTRGDFDKLQCWMRSSVHAKVNLMRAAAGRLPFADLHIRIFPFSLLIHSFLSLFNSNMEKWDHGKFTP